MWGDIKAKEKSVDNTFLVKYVIGENLLANGRDDTNSKGSRKSYFCHFRYNSLPRNGMRHKSIIIIGSLFLRLLSFLLRFVCLKLTRQFRSVAKGKLDKNQVNFLPLYS